MRSEPNHFAPLPGTEPTPKGLFIDRWGTLLELPESFPCEEFSGARFTAGAVDALFRARQAGWSLYLIGNEEDVAMGRLPEEAWLGFERALLAHLAAQGVVIARCYACLDHPEGKGAHQKPSVFLLPDTGLLYHAAQVDGIDLGKSWVVGDSTLELVAGERGGCRTAAVRTGLGAEDGNIHVDYDLIVPDLAGFVDVLLGTQTTVQR